MNTELVLLERMVGLSSGEVVIKITKLTSYFLKEIKNKYRLFLNISDDDEDILEMLIQTGAEESVCFYSEDIADLEDNILNNFLNSDEDYLIKDVEENWFEEIYDKEVYCVAEECSRIVISNLGYYSYLETEYDTFRMKELVNIDKLKNK